METNRKSVYVPLDNEFEKKKQYLISKGFKISFLVRNLLSDLYDREKQKETS